jgi:hypothetical protein
MHFPKKFMKIIKNKKVAFVIPIYPDHYTYLDHFNNLKDDLDIDIYLILSYKEDLDILNSLNINKVYKTILLEDQFDRNFISSMIESRVIIHFKKLYALNLLKDQYEYVAAVDAETEFVSTRNVYEKFKSRCEIKKYFGSTVIGKRGEFFKNIMEHPSIFFNDKIEELQSKTYDLTFYFWFSDIPIYDTTIAKDFLKFIEFENYEKFVDKISWWIFDYILYGYYCILYKDYEVVNLRNYGLKRNWSLESIPIETYFEVFDLVSFKPLWLIHDTYYGNKNILENEDILMTYHRNNGRPLEFLDD